jgi:hypothetical protein
MVAVADSTAVEAVMAAVGIINRNFVMFLMDQKIQKWRESICGE